MQPWLNFNHLYYFWVVARTGSIASACEELMLSPPTVSTQLKTLETNLGQRLFERQGRGMVLTPAGRLVFRHADEMFRTATDLMETLRGRPPGRPMRLTLGIAESMPKTVSCRLVRPLMSGPDAVSLVCHQGKPAPLLAELALHELDAVITDSPIVPEVRVKVYTHLLGECSVSLLGVPELAQRYGGDFPKSLDGAPMLLPTGSSALRRMLDAWFQSLGLRPEIRGEIADSALIKVFGQAGEGLFFVPSVIEAEVCEQYHVQLVRRLDDLRERFFAVTIERTIHHPAVIALCEAARQTFGALATPPEQE